MEKKKRDRMGGIRLQPVFFFGSFAGAKERETKSGFEQISYKRRNKNTQNQGGMIIFVCLIT